MRNFSAVVLAAVVSSPAFVMGYDCTTDPTAIAVPAHNTFCEDFNEWFDGVSMIATNLIMTSYEVDIPAADGDGGGKLALFRITGVTGAAGASGPADALNECQNRGTAGNNRPVLLIPDCAQDASSWFETAGEDSLPGRLCKDGFDVWLANPKGSWLRGEDGATVSDPTTYWDDTIEDAGSHLGLLQAEIIDQRTLEDGTFETNSVRWLAKGCGAQEAANWLVNDTATPDANLPERLTTIAACHVPAASFAELPCTGVVAPETRRLSATDLEIGNDHRELSHMTHSHWDPWFHQYFDGSDYWYDYDHWHPAPAPAPAPSPSPTCAGKADYYTELRRLKSDVLDAAEYKAFYDRLLAQRIAGGYGPTYCQTNWADIVLEALCFVQPTNADCPAVFPTLRECLSDLVTGFRDCGASSIFGADMDTTLACLCPNGDGSDTYAAACEAWGLSSVAPYPFETKEIGLTKFEHILQQAFYGKSTKFSETFATDDDTTVLDEWDYTGIDRTKIFAHWVRGDLNCPADANQAVQDTFPDANRIGDNEFNDGRTHFPFFLDFFGVEDSAYYALLADLVDEPTV